MTLLAVFAVAAACSSGGGTAASSTTAKAKTPPSSSPAKTARDVKLDDDANDCVDASNEHAVDACPAPGLDIRSVTFSRGSLRITFEVDKPGVASLDPSWRVFLAIDVDGQIDTGRPRFFKINNEAIGADIYIEARPTGKANNQAAATATLTGKDGVQKATFSTPEGVTGKWLAATRFEIVVPDVALEAVPAAVGALRSGSNLWATVWMCFEETTSRGAFRDCLRHEDIDLDTVFGDGADRVN